MTQESKGINETTLENAKDKSGTDKNQNETVKDNNDVNNRNQMTTNKTQENSLGQNYDPNARISKAQETSASVKKVQDASVLLTTDSSKSVTTPIDGSSSVNALMDAKESVTKDQNVSIQVNTSQHTSVQVTKSNADLDSVSKEQDMSAPVATSNGDSAAVTTTQDFYALVTTTQDSSAPITTSQDASVIKPLNASASETTSKEVRASDTTSQDAITSLTTFQDSSAPVTTSMDASPSVTTSQDVSSTVTTSEDASSSVTSSQVTSASVTTSQDTSDKRSPSENTIAPVTTSQDAIGPVTTSPDAITLVSISYESSAPVTTSQDASPSVTTSQDSSAPVTTSQDSSAPVTISQAASSSVTPSQEASAAVTTSQEASASVTTSQEASASVTTSQEASASVTPSQESSAPVTTSKDSSASVTTSQDSSASVITSQEASASETTSQEASASVTTSKDSSASVTTSQDSSASVTTSQEARASVTTSKDSSASVTTSQDSSASVTTSQEASASVTTSNDSSASVTTSKDSSASVTTSKEASASVTTSNDVSAAVTTSPDAREAVTISQEANTPVTTVDTNISVPDSNQVTAFNHNALLRGKCTLDNLPRLPKKAVRIFVSSTFTDTKEERNVMMENVYPMLAEYCREALGLEFQIVDMRWGVPEQASDNHSTTQLCLKEIKKCQDVSIGPNFVAIIGNKYGYRPIPNEICATELTVLAEMAAATVPSDQWSVVQEWYIRDTNSVPPVYVLQTISSKIPEVNSTSPDEKQQGRNKWNLINDTLTTALRKCAQAAFERQLFTKKQADKFFISVTESEVSSGVLQQNISDTAFCIIRDIKDIDQHLDHAKVARFYDLQGSATDTEAKTLLNGLRDKLQSVLPKTHCQTFEIEWSISGANISQELASRDQSLLTEEQKLQLFNHREYLDNLCSRFYNGIRRMIQQSTARQHQYHDESTLEILQHLHLAKSKCEVFEGRVDILQAAKAFCETPPQSGPLVIYGNSGSGKTSVIAKILNELLLGHFKVNGSSSPNVVVRFLGTSPNTSNLHQLLVSVCSQLSQILQKDWKEPDNIDDITTSFHELISAYTQNEPLVLIFDSIDQLLSIYEAYKLKWLPVNIPDSVKIIVSTIEEDYPILPTFKSKYSASALTLVKVEELGQSLGVQVIMKWLQSKGRIVTDMQKDLISSALEVCSLPLYARITFDHVVEWKSYETPLPNELGSSVQGAIIKFFESLEIQFGDVVIKHCLAYLTASRNGLSETELEHILSTDDTLLNNVFQFWKPPVRRLPPLIWVRVRSAISNYIVERSADDATVLYWYHRQFIQASKTRYLKEQSFVTHVHEHMADYFSGKWSEGRKKPFTYTDAQVKRFALSSAQSSADRKLPSQSYCTEVAHQGSTKAVYNKRKISELPFNFVKCKRYDALKEDIFFNYEWLYYKIKSSSVQQLLEEVEIFMLSDKLLNKDVEMKTLYANLQLIRPDILRSPQSLSYELQGTLAKHVGKHESITALVQHCDQVGVANCPIVPLTSCFGAAEIGFSQNIHFRRREPTQPGGACTCSKDFTKAYIIDFNKKGKPVLLLFDLQSCEKVREIAIKKTRPDGGDNVTDIYFQIALVQSETKLIAFYKIKDEDTYLSEIRKGSGFLDVIDIETGNIENSYDCFLYRDEFFTPLMYSTNQHICITNGWKLPLISLADSTVQNFSRPSLLSQDERFLILCNKDNTVMKAHESKELIGDFTLAEAQMAVAASDDFSVIAMIGIESRDISIYDLSNKQLKTKKYLYQLYKPKYVFKLDGRTNESIEAVFKPITHINEKGQTEEVTNNRVMMKVSPDKHHLLVCFIGWKWTAFMWCLNIGRYSAKFVGNISGGIREVQCKLPQFSHDGSCLVYNISERVVVVVSPDTGQVLNEYTLQEDIKDIYVSPTCSKVSVMLPKSMVIVDLSTLNSNDPKNNKKLAVESNTQVLLRRESNWDGIYHEVVCFNTNDGLKLEEIPDVIDAADTDRVASARSKKQHAIATYKSKNGRKVLQFNSKLQVIDTKQDVIKYTPKGSDKILRVKQETGYTANEELPLPNGHSILELVAGDRIVNENNRVKFRVTKEQSGDIKIMSVPSVLTVFTLLDLKPKISHRLNVYKQGIMFVGALYLVTRKSTHLGHFFNVFSLESGELLVTHPMNGLPEVAHMNEDESRLFVIDRRFILKYLTYTCGFKTVEKQIELELVAETTKAFVPKSILVFPQAPDGVLIQYGPEGSSAFITSRYIKLDIPSGALSQEMKVIPGFQDVTPDGRLAIDATLNMYDLDKGLPLRRIPYAFDKDPTMASKIQGARLNARISGDKRYVVVFDRQDASLNLVSLDTNVPRFVVSCNSHVTDISAFQILFMRNQGSVITLKSREKQLHFLIAGKVSTTKPYNSEQQRAAILMETTDPNYFEDSTYQSVYKQRETIQAKQNSTTRDSNNKPTLLAVGESFILTNVFCTQFSDKLDIERLSCQTAEEALTKLRDLEAHYDALVLQLIINDVIECDVTTCVSKVKAVVEVAKTIADFVVLSEEPPRCDSLELNDKAIQVNGQLASLYTGARKEATVQLCSHTNLGVNNKPSPKFYQDGTILNSAGVKKMMSNFKTVLAPHYKLHHI